VGSCAGIFYAFDKNTGAIRWKFDTHADQNTSFHGNPIVTDDLVVLDADLPKGHVYALELATGAVRWKFRADEGVPSDLIRHGDTVFAVTSEDRHVALDLKTGRLKWERFSGADRSDRTYPASPRIAGNVVLFGGRNGLVQALDANTGDVKWTRQLNGRVSTPPTLIDGGVYVGSSKGSIYRLTPTTGVIEHELVLPGSAYGNPIPIANGIVVPVYENNLVSLDRELTRIRWQQSGRGWAFRPLIWKGLIVLGNAAGDLFAFNPEDGSPAWSHHFKGIITSTGASGDILYVGTQEGMVFAVRRPK
jgi:eukaryotic-like serine/threonine-protein kinase